MKKITNIISVLALLPALCACRAEIPAETVPPTIVTEAAASVTTEVTEAAASVTTEATETTEAPTTAPETVATEPVTQTTDDGHSGLYDPDYSQAKIWEYFQEVVLDMEYTTGEGDVTLVQKWISPIYYEIYGEPTEEDLAVLTSLFDRLNQIDGFPGIFAVADGYEENCTIRFLGPEDFQTEFSDVVQGEDAYGATQFWYYNDTNDIYTGRIGYRTDLDQTTRNSILLEEVVNMLGITDTVLREDSIVYQYSNTNTDLSAVDWIILKLLYAPEIQCGMDHNRCKAVVEDLYY